MRSLKYILQDELRAIFCLFLYLLAFSLPFSSHISSKIIIAFDVIWLIIVFKSGWTYFVSLLIRHKIFIALILLILGVVFINSFRSKEIFLGFNTLGKLSIFVFVGIPLVINDILSKKVFLRVSWFFIASILIVIFLNEVEIVLRFNSIKGHTFLNDFFGWWYTHKNFMKLNPMHPTYFGAYMNLCILFLFKLYYDSSRIGYLILSLVLSIILITQLASKASIVILFVVFLFIFLIRFKNNYKLFLVSLFLVIAFLFLFRNSKVWFIDRFASSYEKMISKVNSTSRFEIWECGISIFKSNPILGTGTNNYIDSLLLCYERNGYSDALSMRYNLHNEYLTWLIQHGLIGFLSFSALLIMLIYSSIKSNSYVFVGFLFIVLVTFSIETFLARNKGILFFVFFSSIFYALFANRNDMYPMKTSSDD